MDGYWQSLVSASLLGTDRRDPPWPPEGPLGEFSRALLDAALDPAVATPSRRLLAQVAACAAVRRGAALPAPPLPVPAAPPEDRRPVVAVPAANAWRRVVADWPILEDEWLLVVARSGRRVPPELVAPLLARHRHDVIRRARVHLAAGPLAAWLEADFAHLAPSGHSAAPSPEALAELPALPVADEHVGLLAADPREAVRHLPCLTAKGALTRARRPLAVNAIARANPMVLADAAVRLQADPGPLGIGYQLADLAQLRAAMLGALADTL